jgi:hypothetical protein
VIRQTLPRSFARFWKAISYPPKLFDIKIDTVYEEGELVREATYKDFLLVRQEGSRMVRRGVAHYNLDMIISVGYRVKSLVATHFRTRDT